MLACWTIINSYRPSMTLKCNEHGSTISNASLTPSAICCHAALRGVDPGPVHRVPAAAVHLACSRRVPQAVCADPIRPDSVLGGKCHDGWQRKRLSDLSRNCGGHEQVSYRWRSQRQLFSTRLTAIWRKKNNWIPTIILSLFIMWGNTIIYTSFKKISVPYARLTT